MSERKLYAVKNAKGIYLSYSDDKHYRWREGWREGQIVATTSQRIAHDLCTQHGGHVVTLVEEPKPLVVPEWFDKWLDAFCRQGDGYSWRGLAVGRILQQGWGKSINDSYKAFEAHWAIPYVENKQVDYVLHHKKELMVAALTGNYTVEKEKKYNVKVPHTEDAWYYKSWNGNLRTICQADKKLRVTFTEAEIEHYGLQDCEKEEVTDDDD